MLYGALGSPLCASLAAGRPSAAWRDQRGSRAGTPAPRADGQAALMRATTSVQDTGKVHGWRYTDERICLLRVVDHRHVIGEQVAAPLVAAGRLALGHQVAHQLFHLMNQWVFIVDLIKLF